MKNLRTGPSLLRIVVCIALSGAAVFWAAAGAVSAQDAHKKGQEGKDGHACEECQTDTSGPGDHKKRQPEYSSQTESDQIVFHWAWTTSELADQQ